MAGTDFSHLTTDELIKGIKALDLPDYIRSKAYGIDVRETLAQMTEMTIQLGVNMGLSPDEALKWARKLQESVSQSEFDSWVATLLDGGPSIFMNTLNELKITYPNGAAGVALVRETDPAKIYVWDGSAWEDFGDYQGIEIKNGSVTSDKIAKGAVTPETTNFINVSKNIFDEEYVIGGLPPNGIVLFNLENDRIAMIRIKPNTTYSILKSDSNRFRVGLANYNEFYSDTVDYKYQTRIIKLEGHDDETFTFTSGINEDYLIILVSAGATANTPARLQVEEGDTPTAYEPRTMTLSDKINIGLIEPENTSFIEVSKNIFDEEYVIGGLPPNGIVLFNLENDRLAMVEIKPNTTYTIHKSVTNRFRVGLANYNEFYSDEATWKYQTRIIKLEGHADDTFTFTSGINEDYLIILVSAEGANPPAKMQIEEGDTPTEYMRKGLKRLDNDIMVSSTTESSSTGNKVSVGYYKSLGYTDTQAIQFAFNESDNQIVEFEAGKTYVVDKTIFVDADKVKGVNGNNATVKGNFDDDFVFEIIGSFNTGSTGVADQTEASYNSYNSYFERLRITGYNDKLPSGISLNNVIMYNIENNTIYKVKYGIVVGSRTRNLIVSKNHIYNTEQDNIFFNKSDLHQLIINDNHLSYGKNNVRFMGGNLANIVINGNSFETSVSDYFTHENSIIRFELLPGEGITYRGLFEVVVISGNNLQSHHTNNKNLIDIDAMEVDKNECRMNDLTIVGNHVGNCSGNSVSSIALKGVDGANITGNTIMGYPTSYGLHSILLEGINKKINISANNLDKPVFWENATIEKMVINGNILEEGTMTDSNDSNILVSNNL